LEFEQCYNATLQLSGLGNCSFLHIPNSQVYVNRTNVEFMKLGLIGTSVLVASGDDGTVGGHNSWDNCLLMGPIFPASSPYVTTCGATSVEPSSEQAKDAPAQPPICTNAQYACTCSTSSVQQPATSNNTAGFDTGGGFSWTLPQPAYQAEAVQAYIKSGVVLPSKTLWNPLMRGYPDIAAVGGQICVVDPNTACSFTGGTSAAAPQISALVSLLNNDRLNAGKKSLGFMNPLLYKMFAASSSKYFYNGFNDGNNGGECGNALGFFVNPGYWTPLTGLGTPNFDAIRAYVAGLP